MFLFLAKNKKKKAERRPPPSHLTLSTLHGMAQGTQQCSTQASFAQACPIPRERGGNRFKNPQNSKKHEREGCGPPHPWPQSLGRIQGAGLGQGRKQKQNEKKKGGVGWEGKKNSIFVKREKDLVENFYWGFLNLKKNHKKRQKKKKETILASYVYQLTGAGVQGAGLRV